MKYATGGVIGQVGATLDLEVPVAGKAPAAQPAPAAKGATQPAGAGTDAPAEPTGPVVKEDGEDILIDPPVRNLPQWDGRWGGRRIAGPKTGKMFDWQENGCNASTAAMILRWFAEDCPAGKIAFPTKPSGAVDASWYGLRMGEAFWPQADPPGKVELTTSGSIHFTKLYGICANYLKTSGQIDASGKPKAHFVDSKPPEGWMALLRKLLKSGPVIVGLGAPAGHFVLCHGVQGGGLLIVDPGNVLYTAAHGGKGAIKDWSGKSGYADGKSDAAKVRMPRGSQWPGGSAPGDEGDPRAYNHVSGAFLEAIFDGLISLTSLTDPEGAKFGAAPPVSKPAAQPAQPADDKPEPRPGYPLLPEDMKARYLKMSFTLDGEQVDISLEHLIYQNLSLKENHFNEVCKNVIVGLVLELQKKEKDWLDENIGQRLATGAPAFVMHAMCGKGSPEQIQAVLKIAGHCHKRLGRDWPNKGTMSESLTAFYRANMGLDCSGFAGNYARALGGTSLEPNSPIPSFAPPARRRRKLDEILPGDVIIWNPGHIATIQGRRSDGLFDIVESNGETEVQGLGNTTRELTETGTDQMHIRKLRLDGTMGQQQTVWVATIK